MKRLKPTRWGWAIIAMWAALFVIAPLQEYGPKIEATLFPPTSTVELVNVKDTQGGVIVQYLFDKRRDVCALESAAWFLPVDDAKLPVRSYKVDGSRITSLPKGRFLSGKFFVGLTRDNLLNHAELWWTHNCHWPDAWVMRRRVYP